MADAQINMGTPDIASAFGGLSSIDADLRPMMKQKMQENKKIDEYTDKAVKQVEEAKFPEQPKHIEPPQPKDYNTSPMETFGSAAMMVATFGSLLTKHSATTALNSAAGVMKAANQKDANAFNQAMEKYKVDVENMKMDLDYQVKLYDSIVDKPEHVQRLMLNANKDSTGTMMLGIKSLEAQRQMLKAQQGTLNEWQGKMKEVTERKEHYKEADPTMSDFDAGTKAWNEVVGTSAQQKETIEQQHAENIIGAMDKTAAEMTKPGGVLSTGAASVPGRVISSIGGAINPKEADERIQKINSRLQTIKLELKKEMKIGRLKIDENRLDEAIPDKGFHSEADALAGMNEVRNMMANDFDLPEKDYDIGEVPGIFENTEQNINKVQKIQQNPIMQKKGNQLLDELDGW